MDGRFYTRKDNEWILGVLETKDVERHCRTFKRLSWGERGQIPRKFEHIGQVKLGTRQRAEEHPQDGVPYLKDFLEKGKKIVCLKMEKRGIKGRVGNEMKRGEKKNLLETRNR